MFIFNKENVSSDNDLGEAITHKQMNIQNLQVIEGHHMYSLYNKVKVSSRRQNNRDADPM